jgi:hypothetical protein
MVIFCSNKTASQISTGQAILLDQVSSEVFISQYFIGLRPPFMIFLTFLVSSHLKNGERAIFEIGACMK